MDSQSQYHGIKSLIDCSTNKEHECRYYLQYTPHFLFKESLLELVYHEKEYRSHSGDSDYIISGKVRAEDGTEYVAAYLWELKAPQCFIFERETENRLKPSSDLIKAENQLLCYYDELKGSSQFMSDFKITHPDHIKFGGIIIGCSRTFVRGTYDAQKKKTLYERATRIRKTYFYEKLGIKLVNWDIILDQFQQKSEHGRIYKNGQLKISIPKAVDLDVVVVVE